MTMNERQIGKIIKVETYEAIVELSADTGSYVKNSMGKSYPIAKINSYVILPIGAERIVAIVTSMNLFEETDLKYRNQQMLVLPNARRLMHISFVGTIKHEFKQNNKTKEFKYGINQYPELDNPVWFATEEDLDVIFEVEDEVDESAKPLISIGKSPIFEDYDVKINMDKFFGKHAAILGNTGSGKSCTVTAVIRAVMKKTNMPHAHFIIFDTNSEYEAAFTIENEDSTNKYLFNRLVISNEGDKPTGFWVPHWFMNGRDYQAMFRPGEGVQGPVLNHAIEKARFRINSNNLMFDYLQNVEQDVFQIEGIIQDPKYKALFNIKQMVDASILWIDNINSELDSVGFDFKEYKAVEVLAKVFLKNLAFGLD